jgi:hypothetical protein
MLLPVCFKLLPLLSEENKDTIIARINSIVYWEELEASIVQDVETSSGGYSHSQQRIGQYPL